LNLVESLEKMVKKIRNDRICWDFDFSNLHFGFTLGFILLSEIDYEVRIKILSSNTASLLHQISQRQF